jgi:hypothetical protein
MSRFATASITPVIAAKRKGTLHIRTQANASPHKTGAFAVRFQRADLIVTDPQTCFVASALDLLDLLEELGFGLATPGVRAGLAGLYAQGSASIPDVWLTDEEASRHGLA